jgi:hypothetical protein
MATLSFTPSFGFTSHIALSDERRQEVGTLGAALGLMVVYGKSTDPVNPILLQFLLNDCNPRSLHSPLILEYAPQLHMLISTWRELGPDGDIDTPALRAAFAAHLDVDVSCHMMFVL